MTARRPDGSGGSLARDERIDDIQFYIDPAGELLIDDLILYEAAPGGEPRIMPSRPIFTGWFDTGKQGVEWPGEFQIVLHEKPWKWDAAKSVSKEAGIPLCSKELKAPRFGAWARGQHPIRVRHANHRSEP